MSDDEWLDARPIGAGARSSRRAARRVLAQARVAVPRRRARRGARSRARVARRPRRSVPRPRRRRRGGRGAAPARLSPRPGAGRARWSPKQVEAHLDAVEADQQDDGGWMFDWLAWSPAQTTTGAASSRSARWSGCATTDGSEARPEARRRRRAGRSISRSPRCQRTSSEADRLRRIPSAEGLSPHTVATKDVIPAARASAASASRSDVPTPRPRTSSATCHTPWRRRT